MRFMAQKPTNPPSDEQAKSEKTIKPALEASVTETAKPAPTGNGKRILIVEDERPLSHALEMKLKNQGYESHVVTNGAEAIAELKKNHYDLVLLDLIMPVMDGFAVLEELKVMKNATPVIVLSNLGQDEDRAKTKALGALEYFVKSNTPIADIIGRVKTALLQ